MVHQFAIIEDDPSLQPKIVAFMEREGAFRCKLAADSIGDFLEKISVEEKIDFLLLDIMLGSTNSLKHLSKLRRLLGQAKIIIMTGKSDSDFLVEALQAGADSYFLKGASFFSLIDVVRETLAGGTFIAPSLASSLVDLFRRNRESATPVEQLQQVLSQHFPCNPRELQVAMGLMDGKSYHEIANQHHIALNTVRHYVKTLYRKVGVNNKIELVKKLKNIV